MIVRMDFTGACGHDMAAVYGVPDVQAGWQLTFSGWFCQLEICKTSGTRLFWVLVVQHFKALRLGPLAEAVEARQTHQHVTNAASQCTMLHRLVLNFHFSRQRIVRPFSSTATQPAILFLSKWNRQIEVCWSMLKYVEIEHAFFILFSFFAMSLKSPQKSGHSGHGRGWDARTPIPKAYVWSVGACAQHWTTICIDFYKVYK